MKTPLFLCCFLISSIGCPASASTSEQRTCDVRYVAPAARGSGDGKTKNTAALYTDSAFWEDIKSALADHAVSVRFLTGRYGGGPLILKAVGHPKHLLTIQGRPNNRSIFDAGSIPDKSRTTGLILRDCRNITIRHLFFTGKGKLSFISHALASSNILFESCSWADLPNVVYGATGSSGDVNAQPNEVRQSKAHHITFKNCVFKRVGTTPGAHMIYNAYGSQHVRVINCNFEDCSGDYVRFRDLTDYGVVSGCRFKSTGRYPPDKPGHRCFIAVPLYSDANPGDEWFGTHFFFADNRFVYERPSEQSEGAGGTAIRFAHRGFDPPGRSCLLTPEQGEILETGTTQERKDLLLRTAGIDTDEVHVFGNKYTGVGRKATYHSSAAYGAKSKGWGGVVEIYDLLNHETISLADWIAETERGR